MIGEKIREIRKSKKLTQKELAVKAGINKNSIARYEQGKVSPTETLIRKIAQALDIYPSELLENVSNENHELNSDEKQEFNMSFWGTVVDNAKKLAASEKSEEIDLIFPLIYSAYKILAQAKTKGENNFNVHGSVNVKQENIGRDATVNVNKFPHM